MKIAFILSHGVIASSNGVVSQALTWKNGLEELGHDVELINMWHKNDWTCFDVIHYFGFSIYMRDHIMGLSKMNPNIIISPILDPNYSIFRLKIYSHWGNLKLNLTNPYHGLFCIKNKVKAFLARSEFEREYMTKGFNVNPDKCLIVPLSYGDISMNIRNNDREPFCLHISLLTDERKNVHRLIKAAKKYNFRLVLGGKLRNEQERELLKKWINEDSRIEYRGFLSEQEKQELYFQAKVFALPSTNEGVGIVALEAAASGCDIVMTNIGGPKEYYNGMAKIVNPYDVDNIGKAIIAMLEGGTFQPYLKEYIQSHFSLPVISMKLEEAYMSIL